MEMTFGSFCFLVGREGSLRFLAPIFSGLLAAEPDHLGSSTSSVKSGDEEISPPRSIKPANSGKLTDLFGGMTFGSVAETDLHKDSNFEGFTNFDFTSTFDSLIAGRSSPIYMTVSPTPSSARAPLQHTIRSACSQHRVIRWRKMSNLRLSIHWATPWSIPQISPEEQEEVRRTPTKRAETTPTNRMG
jgi:hypothetical protein